MGNRKNTIKMTERELKRVITESVKRVLKEQSTAWVENDPVQAILDVFEWDSENECFPTVTPEQSDVLFALVNMLARKQGF